MKIFCSIYTSFNAASDDGNVLVTLLKLRVCMRGGNHLLSGNSHVRLLWTCKIWIHTISEPTLKTEANEARCTLERVKQIPPERDRGVDTAHLVAAFTFDLSHLV
ncbi:hypothetical protein EVAR_43536_1 [Eumeta japonica]|uniref:Uncharacterized protein n=1 Tax=Eumeta variegata TaxID=151549 RepID=A0A4C1WCJ7_EUMVA|nr:hypothetical protein EVAR_43536_1 [Eumeta japonica]